MIFSKKYELTTEEDEKNSAGFRESIISELVNHYFLDTLNQNIVENDLEMAVLVLLYMILTDCLDQQAFNFLMYGVIISESATMVTSKEALNVLSYIFFISEEPGFEEKVLKSIENHNKKQSLASCQHQKVAITQLGCMARMIVQKFGDCADFSIIFKNKIYLVNYFHQIELGEGRKKQWDLE